MRPTQWFHCSDTLHRAIGSFLIIFLTVSYASALYVVPGSNCTPACSSALTAYKTNGTDIACHDRDYNGTVVGEAFQDCITCEMSSQTVDPYTVQTDLGWALYNMRYALDWCLFEFHKHENQSAANQCTSSCANISTALEINVLTPNATTTYDYCQDQNFLPNVEACAACYKVIPDQLYLSNFLKTLEYACQSQPSPTLPFPINPSDVFTYQPPSNYSDLDGTSGSRADGLSPEARAAIAIIVPVVAFLLISLILLLFYVRRHDPSAQKEHSHHSERFMTEKFTSHKHMSKSTPGWSHSSTTPLQKSTHSRNQSVNSRQIYPAPLNPQKVPMPAPLRPQKSKSPIPFSRLNDHSEPMRTRNSPIPFSDLFNKSPKKPPSEKSDDGTFLPATKYSPPPPIPPIPPILPEPSITAHPRRPSGPPTGLVSWERVAIQNARIRATQGTSPSPVSPLTQVRVVPIPRSPDFAREGYPFRVGTPRQPEPPRRRGTPGAGEALRQALSSPLSPLRSSTPDPDDGKLVRGSGSGSGGVMRKGSRRSEKARKEVRWSKDVDYEG